MSLNTPQQDESSLEKQPESAPLRRRRILQRHESEQQPSSSWADYECTTPMTSRPHFQTTRRSSPQHHPIRRVRSRSLGAEIDDGDEDDAKYYVSRRRNGHRRRDSRERRHLLLPPLLVVHKSNQTTIATTSDDDDDEKPDQIPEEQSSSAEPSGQEEAETTTTPVLVCILYGMINATIILPVLFSFGSIIYRDPAFGPHLAVLLRLTVISGIVHQLCFSTCSSLPFCVGQVQDAGLIFLSSMASRIVEESKSDDPTTNLLATSVVVLSLATAVLGCGLVGIGYLQLAQYVQLLPTCVVGGYLAYIGWFCGTSGIGLMSGVEPSLHAIFDHWPMIAPGLFGGLAMYMAVTRVRHVAALPVSIALEMLLFYVVLWWTGTSVADATTAGWIRAADHPPPSWQHTWDCFRFDQVDWSVLPNLLVTEVSMILVVALSSSLDVAAIELELQRPLDYNHELKTVGFSNIVSGVTGGYTGSYIFSQSIFTLRAGINSRVMGYALAACQMLVITAPVNILAYVPSFFFGSLLTMICIDLMFEWLWDVRTRVLTRTEHGVCVLTFGLIQWLGVEYGILAGWAVHWLCQRVGLLPPTRETTKFPNEDAPSLNDLQLEEEIPLVRDVSSLDDACVERTGLARYGSLESSSANFIDAPSA